MVKYTTARAQQVHHLHRSLPRSDNGMLYISLFQYEIEQTKKRETTTTSNESMHFLTQTRRGVSKDDRISIAIGPAAALPADS